MDIDVPLRELGSIDATALIAAILGQEESVWYVNIHISEQRRHRNTLTDVEPLC